MADVVILTARLSPSSTMFSDEKELTMSEPVGPGERKQVRVKRRFRNLQDLCRAKRLRVPKRVSMFVDLVVNFMDDAVVGLSPGAGLAVDLRIDE